MDSTTSVIGGPVFVQLLNTRTCGQRLVLQADSVLEDNQIISVCLLTWPIRVKCSCRTQGVLQHTDTQVHLTISVQHWQPGVIGDGERRESVALSLALARDAVDPSVDVTRALIWRSNNGTRCGRKVALDSFGA